MTNDEIIRIWREAGFNTTPDGAALKKLNRFVAMVSGHAAIEFAEHEERPATIARAACYAGKLWRGQK